jgi:hypothetical protein
MKSIKVLLLSFVSLCCVQAFAADSNAVSKAQADQFAIDYSKARLLKSLSASNKSTKALISECDPDGESRASCVGVICQKQNCGYQPIFDHVAASCRGADGDCVEVACSKQNCGYQPIADQVASTCKGANGECVKVGCEKQNCGYQPIFEQVTKACQSIYDGGCVRYGCERQNCGYQPTFEQVARSCAGN